LEADWEIESGGGAPVIDAHWAGFVDLHTQPQRVAEIAEAMAFPPLARLLLSLNQPSSPWWTAKCDLWEEPAEETSSSCGELGSPVQEGSAKIEGDIFLTQACYIDLLPMQGYVFARWQDGEEFCRRWCRELEEISLPHARLDLVVRMALAGAAEGFGVTAYLSATGKDRASGRATLERLMTLVGESAARGFPVS
jgi:hypothetical protein